MIKNNTAPPLEIAIQESKQLPLHPGGMRNSLNRFMKSVSSKKRPLNKTRNLFRNTSFNSKATAATATATESSDEVDDVVSSTQRHVRFSSKHDQIHDTLSRTGFTPEEIAASWYQDEEYKQITKDCCKQIKKMDSGEVLKDRKYCSRGLEAHTRLGSITRLKNRRMAFDAVLDEQEEQQQLCFVDEGSIALSYQQVTSSCQMWATAIGLRDQHISEECMD